MPGEQDQETKPGHTRCAVSSSSTQPLSSFPLPPGTGHPWKELGEESTQPHQCQQGGSQRARAHQGEALQLLACNREEEE